MEPHESRHSNTPIPAVAAARSAGTGFVRCQYHKLLAASQEQPRRVEHGSLVLVGIMGRGLVLVDIVGWSAASAATPSNPNALLRRQMNDVWAGASWSGIDIAGRWKPMQYAMKQAFAPVQIQLVQDGAAIQVSGSSSAWHQGQVDLWGHSFVAFHPLCRHSLCQTCLGRPS